MAVVFRSATQRRVQHANVRLFCLLNITALFISSLLVLAMRRSASRALMLAESLSRKIGAAPSSRFHRVCGSIPGRYQLRMRRGLRL